MISRRLGPLAAIALLAAFGAQSVLAVRGMSATSDEATHLAAGYSYLRTGDLRLNPQHPPLIKMLAATPSEGMYRMRAILYRSQEKFDEAISDLNKAVAMQPKDPMTLLQRAEIALDRDDVKSAKEDFRAALAQQGQ